MRLLVSIAAYNEEALIGRAIAGLRGQRVDELHVLDGAWRGGPKGRHVFAGAKTGKSTDQTSTAAVGAGAQAGIAKVLCHPPPAGKPWPSQEAKRTALFQGIGAEPGDWILVLDCDEELEPQHALAIKAGLPDPPADLRAEITGTPPSGAIPLAGHELAANILVRCEGGNDMPGVRGEWPQGDYSADWKPELRLFAYTPDLECVYPGGYWQAGRLIEPYKNQPLASNGDVTWGGVASALPVLESTRMIHHGNDRSADRLKAKLAYYEAEHPERQRWQRAFLKTGR